VIKSAAPSQREIDLPKPLQGLRVADFTHVMAGPFCTFQLCLMGAEVIKIEPPENGEILRTGYGIDPKLGITRPEFLGFNAGKKSVALDLKSPEGKEIARKIIASSDIVVENFRPGVIKKLGFDYETCKKLNPNVIFLSLSGYGQTGPLRDYAAIDHVIQAVCGIMTVSGEKGSDPMRVGFPALDTFAGYMSAYAITSAVLQRERFGGSQYIDAAMLDASLVLMCSLVLPSLIVGKEPVQSGNRGFGGGPTADSFPAADRMVTIGANHQRQFETLCRAIGRPELITDKRFETRASRLEHQVALREELIKTLATKRAEEWEQILNAAGLPASIIRTVPEILKHPHVHARGVILKLDQQVAGRDIFTLNSGFLFAHDGPGVTRAAPHLGEFTLPVLKDLGYADAEIAELRKKGVIRIYEKGDEAKLKPPPGAGLDLPVAATQ
jgi:crotonobetainyl-CoA:carnitine CoA-transferase CaiB-like acyl-CoA transferase